MDMDTRAKLMEVATPLFATKGFAAVSVRELTEAAQINVSAISYHFNGKEGLYKAVLEEQLTPILLLLHSVKSKNGLSAVERLMDYANQIASIHTQRPFLARFINNEANNPTKHIGPMIEDHLSQVYEFIVNTLEEGIVKGEFRENLNTSYSAISLVGILNFYFIMKPLIRRISPLNINEHSNTEYIVHAFQLYLHGIMDQTQVK